MDTDKIKDALDKFEDDDFVGSRDVLSQEIKKAKNNYLKDKLGLKNDIEEVDYEEGIEDIKDNEEDGGEGDK